jgi:transcriptional regulator with XRE-family HTH domain
MQIVSQIKDERIKLGITQASLASQAKISLPALQQLEAGTSNPSLETLARVGRVLGLELQLKPLSCDWDRLCALGVPLTSEVRARFTPSEESLAREVRLALREPLQERQSDALAGLLLALYEHFPSVFKRNFGKSSLAKRLIQNPSGRVIKLKRLAVARVSEYL